MRLPSLLLLVAGAVIAPLSHATSIYDSAAQYTPDSGTACYYDETTPLSTRFNTVVDEKIADLASYATSTVKYLNVQKNGEPSLNEGSCFYSQSIKYEVWNYSSSMNSGAGGWYKNSTQYTSQSASGTPKTITMCPPTGTPEAIIPYTGGGSEILACYIPADLADADTCPDNFSGDNSIIPNQSGLTDSTLCLQMSDGSESMCSYALSADGSYYAATFENTACYSSEPDTLTEPDINTGVQCEELSTGVAMCLENENEMCDSSGVCQEGCGNVGLSDGSSYFICIDADTDGDAIPDYSDTDIDGDGILNEDDDDVDGDGITNNADSDYVSGSSSTGGTVVNVDTSGLEEAITGLISDQDFDAISTGNSTTVDSKITAVDDAADELLDNIDFTGVEEGTGFYSSLDNLATAMASTCQTFDYAYRTQTISVDTCSIKANYEPYLYILFAFGTAFYIFFRVSSGIRGGKE